MTSPSALQPRPGAGRPTRAEAERRHEELLDHALDMFLDKGFEQTTIDAIAARVGMTKRTVYTRYTDKAALFIAAVERAIDRTAVPVSAMRAAETDDLEDTLTAIAELRSAVLLSPAGLRLQRIVNAESYRFPEVARLYFERATGAALAYLADLFERESALGAIISDDPHLLATAFLSLAVGSQTRRVVLGGDADDADRARRGRALVRLFLHGARPRQSEGEVMAPA